MGRALHKVLGIRLIWLRWYHSFISVNRIVDSFQTLILTAGKKIMAFHLYQRKHIKVSAKWLCLVDMRFGRKLPLGSPFKTELCGPTSTRGDIVFPAGSDFCAVRGLTKFRHVYKTAISAMKTIIALIKGLTFTFALLIIITGRIHVIPTLEQHLYCPHSNTHAFKPYFDSTQLLYFTTKRHSLL